MEKRKIATENNELDPELDVTSSQLEPLKVLRAQKIAVPVPRAKVYDNLSVLSTAFERHGGFDADLNKPGPSGAIKKHPNQMPGRKFQPHQYPVTRPKPQRTLRNLLTKMEEGFDGPLALLKKLMDEKTRVTIYTRRKNGVRGSITGYVEAFDKHWNVALADVYEIYKRRKYSHSVSKMPLLGEPQDCSDLLRKMRISIPSIKPKSLDRKYVECSRSCAKLLIRGDQIVLISRVIPRLDKEQPLPRV